MNSAEAKPGEERQPTTLEGKVGANTIWLLEGNPRFKALTDFLRRQGKADESTLLVVYTASVELSLSGYSPEKYVQAILKRLESKGKDLVYMPPEVVRSIAGEIKVAFYQSRSK